MERKLTIALDIDGKFMGDVDYFFDDLDEDIQAAIIEACGDAGRYFAEHKMPIEKEED